MILPGYKYVREVTFNPALITGSHADFPIPIRSDANFLDTELATYSEVSGQDVAFSSLDGTHEYYCDRQYMAFGGPHYLFWVRMDDQVFSASNNKLLMWFGKTGASDNQATYAPLTWADRYAYVCHHGRAVDTTFPTERQVAWDITGKNYPTVYGCLTDSAVDHAYVRDGFGDTAGVLYNEYSTPHADIFNTGNFSVGGYTYADAVGASGPVIGVGYQSIVPGPDNQGYYILLMAILGGVFPLSMIVSGGTLYSSGIIAGSAWAYGTRRWWQCDFSTTAGCKFYVGGTTLKSDAAYTWAPDWSYVCPLYTHARNVDPLYTPLPGQAQHEELRVTKDILGVDYATTMDAISTAIDTNPSGWQTFGTLRRVDADWYRRMLQRRRRSV